MLNNKLLTLRAFLIVLVGLKVAAASAGQPIAKVPSALAWNHDGRLLVALRDARELTTIDPKTWTVVATRTLPFRPSSLLSIGGTTEVLVGGMDGELIAIAGDKIKTLRERRGRGPLQVVAIDAERLAVASPWSRSVELIDRRTSKSLQLIPIGFSPGRLIKASEKRLFVLDAFGSRIARVDLATGAVRSRVIDGVNLHAAALSGDGRELLVGHMSQYRAMPVTTTNIDWGFVISSGLSAVRLSEFEGPDDTEGKVVARRKITLDGTAHGAADPSAMAVSCDGTIVMITISGAHQLLKNDRTLGSTSTGDSEGLLPLGHNQKLETLEVGQSPVDLVLDPNSEFAVTADAMSDTLTVVRVADLEVVKTIALASPENRPNALQRGEAAFNDGRLAHDRWMTCATCHPRGHTNGLNFDTLGDGAYGAAKNTQSLLGLGTTAPYSWIGQFARLTDQVDHSFKTSLRGPAPEGTIVDDLAAYLASVNSPPPLRPSDDPAAVRGAKVFENRKCDSCHKHQNFTSDGIKNVGLDDGPGGHKAFNPPSLRGTAWSAPYFHDGRAATLDDVLDVHPNPGRELSPADRDDLKAYLESL